MLELSRFLHHSHWAVVLCGSLLTILAAVGSRKLNKVLLPMYLLFILYMTVMFRETGAVKLELTLFWSYSQFLSSPGLRMEILNNIWLFVPLGAILFRLIPRWYVVFLLLLISISVEGLQYVLGVGWCELDDVISNGLGGLIGVVVCWVLSSFIHSE